MQFFPSSFDSVWLDSWLIEIVIKVYSMWCGASKKKKKRFHLCLHVELMIFLPLSFSIPCCLIQPMIEIMFVLFSYLSHDGMFMGIFCLNFLHWLIWLLGKGLMNCSCMMILKMNFMNLKNFKFNSFSSIWRYPLWFYEWVDKSGIQ